MSKCIGNTEEVIKNGLRSGEFPISLLKVSKVSKVTIDDEAFDSPIFKGRYTTKNIFKRVYRVE